MENGSCTRCPAILVLGMAGSGKTTFVNAFSKYLNSKLRLAPYIMNLDPAVVGLPYTPQNDIRNTVSYREVMNKYKLGPNGAIITSLNLFCTRFDGILKTLDEKCYEYPYLIVDTPGQMEVFTWSASGMIITEALAGICPTFIIYLVDTPRSSNPCTFMSNMLYALSCMYKARLPLLVVFNKCDLTDSSQVKTWLTDFEAMQKSLSQESSYTSNLANSLCLALEEFYKELKYATVSSKTGDGFSELIELFDPIIADFKDNFQDRGNKNRTPDSDGPDLSSICGMGVEVNFFPSLGSDD